jgi:acyl-CoA thioesterase II
VVGVSAILDALALEPVGEDRYRAGNVDTGHNVVFGGQLMAQSVVAAALGHEDKTVKTLHTVFARAAAPDVPVDVSVERVHAGRSLASSTVTVSQGERICTRSMVLLSADEPDLIRHADSFRAATGPEPTAGQPAPGTGEWEVQIVGDVDVSDPDQVGPPELEVWTRFAGAPEDVLVSQALLAFASDGFLIGTAMRPHAGVGQAQAHVSISTGVLSHTLTFHEHFSAGHWLLLAHRSTHAGHGRSYGRAEVFDEDGQLVASFVQDAMIRAMTPRTPERQGWSAQL